MLDWPEACHTSPTRMFLRTTWFSPSRTTISAGWALASRGSSLIIHLPSAPAWALCFCPANSTVTVVPGLLQPHTGTGISRCRIALSRNGRPNSMAGGGACSCANSDATGDSSRATIKAIANRAKVLRVMCFCFMGNCFSNAGFVCESAQVPPEPASRLRVSLRAAAADRTRWSRGGRR